MIWVLGAGRAGGTLSHLLARRGLGVGGLVTRHPARAARLVTWCRAAGIARPTITTDWRRLLEASIVLLAVPDDALPGVARRLGDLARRQREDGARPGRRPRVALHLSGAAPLSVLDPLAAAGHAVGSLHPLCVLPATRPPLDLLAGVAFAVAGQPAARRSAVRLARRLGGVPWHLPETSRLDYHLAAAVVANDSVALVALAIDRLRAAGLGAPTARRALARLLLSTAQALHATEPARALTGPVARGDAGTLRAHLRQARRVDPDLARLHGELSRVLRNRVLSRRRRRST